MAQEDEDAAEETVVRVKAQVMTRGEYGWKPLEGGGMSYVCVHKRWSQKDEVVPKYFIQGTRISDDVVLLECLLNANVEYERADPTFHHWKLDGKKYGLTFLTNSDARTFSQGIKDAVHDLSKGVPRENFSLDIAEDEVYRVTRNSSLPTSSQSSTSPQSVSSPSASSSQPSSTLTDSSRRCSPIVGHVQSRTRAIEFPNFHKIIYEQPCTNSGGLQTKTRGSNSVSVNNKPRALTPTKIRIIDRRPVVISSSNHKTSMDGINNAVIKDSWDPYVHFEKKDAPKTPQYQPSSKATTLGARQSQGHMYSYPSFEVLSSRVGNSRREMPVVYNFKNRQTRSTSEPQIASLRCTTPPLPARRSSTARQKLCLRGSPDERRITAIASSPKKRQCAVCQEHYWPKDNRPGSCKDGRDSVKDGIECATCVCCAHCLLYRCARDSEGDYPEPCSCGGGKRNCRQWTLLAVLSFFLPCLWCYLPLSSCHRSCVSHGHCGPRHRPAGEELTGTTTTDS